MPSLDTVPDIARAIQLAVAPVFLLTGIAALLGVMTNRLARIIDRGRQFEERWARLDDETRKDVQTELSNLERRRRLASRAINACTFAALLICMVVATLFIEAFLTLPLGMLAGLLFVGSMFALIFGLTSFLREVYIATHTVRIWKLKVAAQER